MAAGAGVAAVETEERKPIQGYFELQPAGIGEQLHERSEGEKAQRAQSWLPVWAGRWTVVPATGIGNVPVGLTSANSRLGHLPRGQV